MKVDSVSSASTPVGSVERVASLGVSSGRRWEKNAMNAASSVAMVTIAISTVALASFLAPSVAIAATTGKKVIKANEA